MPVYAAYVACPKVDNPESLVTPGFSPRRPTVRSGEEVPHRLVVVADRLLLDDHTAVGEPRVVRTCFGQLSTPPGETRHSLTPWTPP
jgi:hypothetical protein